MADRAKRFKACKIRVRTQSTRGKKTTKSVLLQLNREKESSASHSTSYDVLSSDENHFGEIDETYLPCFSTSNESQSNQGISKYHQRRMREFNGWEEVRKCLLNARIEEEAFFTEKFTCVMCQQPAICRCVDCGARQFFCMNCGKQEHSQRNYFHVLEVYENGCFFPLLPNHAVLSLSHQENCPNSECRNIICVDPYGRQHKQSIMFCGCEDDAVTLIKLHLWPGSATRPSVAFHFQLMTLAEQFLLECHVSLKKFCDVLNLDRSSMMPKWINSLYKVLNGDSYDEFRYHQYLFKSGKPFIGNTSAISECPLCPQNGSKEILIESMDGCFGLVRKKSAGMNILPPRHENTFFADQDDVDNFVQKYGCKAKEVQTECNEFKAGEVNTMLRSKGRNKLFDEKGVFGRVCRHEYPKGFLSIKHGERISYSVYEVERLLKGCDQQANVKIMYDIGCTLSSHLKNNDRQDILEKVDLAIPVFHCYGHKSRCQVQFSPRRLKGFGLTDGEGIERLWSYLRGFSAMTKEMTASRRVDVLTDCLIHYAQHRIRQFGLSLVQKFSKTDELLKNAISQLQDIFSSLTVSYDDALVLSWAKEEETLLISREKKKRTPLSWEANYVQKLCCLQELRANVAAADQGNHSEFMDIVRKLKSVLKVVTSIEKNKKVKKRWIVGEEKFNAAVLLLEQERRNEEVGRLYSFAVERMFLISLKRKYSDGQKIAAKLSKQITQRTNSIKFGVTKYNATLALWNDKIEGLPQPLDFDQLKDPESPVYQALRGVTSTENVPFAIKRNVIDLHNFIERCKEEENYLQIEMCRLIEHYERKNALLHGFLEEHAEESSLSLSGLTCILQKRIYEYDNQLYQLRLLFGDRLSQEILSRLPCEEHRSTNMAHIEQDGMEIFEVERDECEEDEDNVDSLSELDDSDSDDDFNNCF